MGGAEKWDEDVLLEEEGAGVRDAEEGMEGVKGDC